ncbi:hypothetical protein ACIRG4_12485 [Streptomyces sp. NPDC102395]|uniref:hypothetical protein n=1 Tax=Streptomyces sp. NPDC102395 TaxID=3366168 RepID=UPI00380C156D
MPTALDGWSASRREPHHNRRPRRPGRDPAHVTDVYHAVRVTTTVREYTSHHEHRRQG